MKKKFAYIQEVANTRKKPSANLSYIQIVTQDMEVYFFTEGELRRAALRAASNLEDQDLVRVTYEKVE